MIKTVKRSVSLILILCLLVPALSGLVLPVNAQEREMAVQNRSNWTYQFYYRHYYDEASFDASYRSRIDEAVAFANNVYSACMGTEGLSVTIQTTGTISRDNYSGLGSCRAGVDTPCRTSAGCGTDAAHHKDIRRISNQLYEVYQLRETVPNTFWVLWCNQDFGTWCEYNSVTGTHTNPDAYAAVISNRPVIHIMSLEAAVTTMEAHMAVLLAHETAHSMGYVDVYNTPYHWEDNVVECIMDCFIVDSVSTPNQYSSYDFYSNIIRYPSDADGAFCQNCREGIAIQIEERFECVEE